MLQESWNYLVLPLESAMIQAGLDSSETAAVLRILETASQTPGRGTTVVALAIKRWQKVCRNILSCEDSSRDDDNHILGCRMAKRCIHIMKNLKLTKAEINTVILRHGRRRIPPFIWSKSLVRILLPNPSYALLRRAIAPATIGRTAPLGGPEVVKEALKGFVASVALAPKWSFDFSECTTRLLRDHSVRFARVSHWEAPGTGSRQFTRSKGGKRGETHVAILNDFMLQPLCSIIPDKPDEEVLDVTGNIVLYPANWSEDIPIGSVIYAKIGEMRSICVDDRFGKIGLLWALLELRRHPGIAWEVDEDHPALGIGRVPLLRATAGSINARVTAQPEEGWKVRIITITDFCASLLGSVGRHLFDPALIGLDPMIRIGLRSKAKLYDSLVCLNGNSHKGLDDVSPNIVQHSFGISADLTTATDTPNRSCINSILEGWRRVFPISNPLHGLSMIILDLAELDRVFEMPQGYSAPVHRNGIMMGEGMSGIFLNTASFLVRSMLPQLQDKFPEIDDLAEDNIDLWITEQKERLQLFFTDFKAKPGLASCQSGDDMFALVERPCSKHAMVLYRCMGFLPSRNTWFESSQFITFCEEHAIRTLDSNGWTYVDSIKPRFFNIKSEAGPIAISSRIRQLTGVLKYRREHEFTRKMIPLVDRMIELCPEIRDTVKRFSIPVGLPSWLGGLDHPIGTLPEYTIPDEYRRLMCFLYECDEVTLVQEFLIGICTDSDVRTKKELLCISSSFLLREQALTLDELTETNYISRFDVDRPERGENEKWGYYMARCDQYIKSLDLISISELVGIVNAAESIRDSLREELLQHEKVSMRRRLRDQKRKLMALVPDDYLSINDLSDDQNSLTTWAVKQKIDRVLGRRLVRKTSFLEQHGLLDLPSFQVVGTSPLCYSEETIP